MVIDYAFITAAFAMMLLPLLAIFCNGINRFFFDVLQDPEVMHAALMSVTIAFAAGLASLVAGMIIVFSSAALRFSFNRPTLANMLLVTSHMNLAISPIMLATGFFLVMRVIVDMDQLMIAIVILLTGLTALPFVVGVLHPPLLAISQQEWWLCRHLSIKGWNLFSLIFWPRIKKRLGFAFAMAMLLSSGDLAIISLFGNQHLCTLPMLLYQKMGSYRTGEAAVIALLMLVLFLSMVLFAQKLDKEGFDDTHY